jgi:hypothetical protein
VLCDGEAAMINLLKEMFSEMVMKMDASLIPKYYHSEFILYANKTISNYQEFLDGHKTYYAEARRYFVEYDEQAWVEQHDKVAGRVFITIKQPDKSDINFEVILICQYKDNKIFRIWEVTSPDWTQMEEFK